MCAIVSADTLSGSNESLNLIALFISLYDDPLYAVIDSRTLSGSAFSFAIPFDENENLSAEITSPYAFAEAVVCDTETGAAAIVPACAAFALFSFRCLLSDSIPW